MNKEVTMSHFSFKKFILDTLGRLTTNGRYAFILSYVHNRGRCPSLSNPKDLSEIWIRRVLDGKINEMAYLADKYSVRSYVHSKGLGDILTPLIGVYNSVNEINFNDFPQRFALKATFGAGMNIICTDKDSLDRDVVKEKISTWLQPRIYSYSERHYNLIPQRVICEKFIDDQTGGFPIDYKFMCIHGKVACILACGGRENGHAQYLPYSVDWKPLYEWYKNVPRDIHLIHRPINLEEMISVACKLAGDIDLVRVDLYSNGKQIWFGEMTLTPSGCIFHRWSQTALNEMGRIYRDGI